MRVEKQWDTHSRCFLSNPTTTTCDNYNLPRLIWDIIRSPRRLRGKELAEDPDAFSDMTQRVSKIMADVGTARKKGVGKREKNGETARGLFV
jgi:hypothetical protein